MASRKTLKILHLTTHLNIGGITSYIEITGSRLLQKGYRISVISSGGNMAEDLRKKDLQVFRFPIRTKNELHPKLYWSLFGIKDIVAREEIDLIHAHTRVTQVLAFWLSKMVRVPFVTTAHGFYKPRLGRRFFGCWGSRVIAISPLVAEDLKKTHHVSEQKIRLVQNAIDAEEFQRRYTGKDPRTVRKALGIPDNALVAGSVSRLVEDKGHAYLIEAVRQLKKYLPNIYLIILGDGREKGNLERAITRSGLNGSARIIPAVKDVTEILPAIDIFVHPATYREGFGFSIAEAMIVGKPVVATNIWAVNSIIQDGINGFLAEPKSPEALAKALKFIAENPETARAIAEKGRQTAFKLCSLDRMVNELEKVYEEVVDEDRR